MWFFEDVKPYELIYMYSEMIMIIKLTHINLHTQLSLCVHGINI